MEETTIIERLKWTGIALLVVFPLLFLGAVHVTLFSVSLFSVRMIVAYSLLMYVLWRGETDYLPTRGMQMYFVYVAIYILVNMLNMTAFNTTFAKDLVAVHFISCIVIFAFPRLFKSEAAVRGAYAIIVLGFMLDIITTILQYNNSPWGWIIGMSINPIRLDELNKIQASLGDASEFRKSIITGIMGRAVGNGYFIATMLPVVTYYVWDKFKLKTLWALALFAVTTVCIYYVQQRMALAVALAYLLSIVVLKKTSATAKFLAAATAAVILVISLEWIMNFDFSQLGRLASTEDKLRLSFVSTLDRFISEPQKLLLGFNQVTNEEEEEVFLIIGHNTFTDALRMGGLFLLITYIVLFYHLCKTLIGIVLFSRREEDFRTMGMAIGCLCFMLYSQTHSTGVQSGSIMFWVLYMLTIQSHRVRCETIEAEEAAEENSEDMDKALQSVSVTDNNQGQ